MADIIQFTGQTCLDMQPDQVLDAAKGQCERVLVVGLSGDGELYFAGSLSEAPYITWLLDRAKHEVMNWDFD